MQDLAEHIGLILSFAGALITACIILIGIIWNNKVKEIEAFPIWLRRETEEGGGVVTRNQFFDWCRENQGGCVTTKEMSSLKEWRNGMYERGGPLLIMDHSLQCEKMIDKLIASRDKILEGVIQQMNERFLRERDKTADSLQLIQSTMEGKVLKEIQELRKDLNGRGKKE